MYRIFVSSFIDSGVKPRCLIIVKRESCIRTLTSEEKITRFMDHRNISPPEI